MIGSLKYSVPVTSLTAAWSMVAAGGIAVANVIQNQSAINQDFKTACTVAAISGLATLGILATARSYPKQSDAQPWKLDTTRATSSFIESIRMPWERKPV